MLCICITVLRCKNVHLIHLFCLRAAGLACFRLRVHREFTVSAVSHRVSVILRGPLCVPIPPQQGSSLQRAANPPQPQPALTEPRRPHSEAAGKQRGKKWGESRRDGRSMTGHQPVQKNKRQNYELTRWSYSQQCCTFDTNYQKVWDLNTSLFYIMPLLLNKLWPVFISAISNVCSDPFRFLDILFLFIVCPFVLLLQYQWLT